MQQMIQYMLTDITEVFQYIPIGIISGILFYLFTLVVKGTLKLLKYDNNTTLQLFK